MILPRFAATFATCFVLLLPVTTAPVLAGDNLGTERGNMKAVLNVVSKELEKNFYDSGMKGLDWKALTEQARQKIDNAQSVSEMMRAIFILVEKLGDSHTRFLPPSRNVSYKFGFNAKPVGDEIHVYEVKENGAAQAAGLKVGDRILAVNKFRADRKTFDVMMWDFRVIQNAPSIELKVQTDQEDPRVIQLEAKKKVQSVVLDFTHDSVDVWDLIRELEQQEIWNYQSFKDGIGFVQLREFEYDGENFVYSLVERSQATRAIILDLRNNGGGAEDALKNLAGNFESEQVVMGTIKGRKKDDQIILKPHRPHYDMPMYILIDSETGSAAEMFAKHFQLRKKAVIIGDHSSGRVTRSMYFPGQIGTDQIIPFGVQIGVSRFVFPDGTELEKNGVTPDVQCIPTGREMREQRDVCVQKAVAMAREKLGLAPDTSTPDAKRGEVSH